MIHRFVDLWAVEAGLPPMLYHLQNTTGGNTYRTTYLAGGGLTPVEIPETRFGTPSVHMVAAHMSEDGAEVTFSWKDNTASTIRGRVYRCRADDTDSAVILANNPTTSGTENQDYTIPYWHPDGTQIFYRGETTATNRPAEIRVMDRDGTNNTLLYTRTPGTNSLYASATGPQGVLPSYDGSLLAWWDANLIGSDGGARGLWVMNADGTGATRIYASTQTSGIICWANTSNDIAFQPNTPQIYRLPSTGGTPTTLWSAASPAVFLNSYLKAWTPDDSGLLVIQDQYVSAPKYVLGILETDGSETFTEFSPERRKTITGNDGPKMGPDGRVYWYYDEEVQSIELDGSGYLVDHDLAPTDLQFRGFHGVIL